jgi:hypothetical protein
MTRNMLPLTALGPQRSKGASIAKTEVTTGLKVNFHESEILCFAKAKEIED